MIPVLDYSIQVVAEFKASNDHVLGYDHESRTWLSFDGKCWREDAGGVVYNRRFIQFVRAGIKAAADIPDTMKMQEQPKAYVRLETFHAERFEKYARRMMPVNRADFDQQRRLLNVLRRKISQFRPPKEYRQYSLHFQCPIFQNQTRHCLRFWNNLALLTWNRREAFHLHRQTIFSSQVSFYLTSTRAALSRIAWTMSLKIPYNTAIGEHQLWQWSIEGEPRRRVTKTDVFLPIASLQLHNEICLRCA